VSGKRIEGRTLRLWVIMQAMFEHAHVGVTLQMLEALTGRSRSTIWRDLNLLARVGVACEALTFAIGAISQAFPLISVEAWASATSPPCPGFSARSASSSPAATSATPIMGCPIRCSRRSRSPGGSCG
jgi:hypothetical protein